MAENVVYLKFTYDVYNTGVVNANQATLPAGTNPGMITKVNIAHMSMRSQQAKYAGIGYQGLDLQTSIAGPQPDFTAGVPDSGLELLIWISYRRKEKGNVQENEEKHDA